MFDSFARGFRMIWASIKMGWNDKRLLLPSILSVFANIFFGMLFLIVGAQKLGHPGAKQVAGMVGGLNGPHDPAGMGGGMASVMNADNFILVGSLVMIWWVVNRFLEGVTTGLVYSYLTEGKGYGRVSTVCQAVFASLPAILMLGFCTFLAKKLAGWMRERRNTGFLGIGFNFLAGVVEVFWTLAGHLILPAIVIEGTSFWGGLKRADHIAQGNLLTIGVGEVGVDLICRISTWMVYAAGMGGFGYGMYLTGGHFEALSPAAIIPAALLWVTAVVIVTAISIYIRAAFYTCLYVWAIEAETVEHSERQRVKAPGPLAMALA